MRKRWNELKAQILHPNLTWTCPIMLEENDEEMREWIVEIQMMHGR